MCERVFCTVLLVAHLEPIFFFLFNRKEATKAAEAPATASSSRNPGGSSAAPATAEADLDQSSAPSSAYVRSLEEKLEYHRRVIRLYQNLSSLAIHPKEGQAAGAVEGAGGNGGNNVMTCTAVNHLHRRAVRFDLKIPDDEDKEDFAYSATGNAHLLPAYMQVFFWLELF